MPEELEITYTPKSLPIQVYTIQAHKCNNSITFSSKFLITFSIGIDLGSLLRARISLMKWVTHWFQPNSWPNKVSEVRDFPENFFNFIWSFFQVPWQQSPCSNISLCSIQRQMEHTWRIFRVLLNISWWGTQYGSQITGTHRGAGMALQPTNRRHGTQHTLTEPAV